MSGEKFASLTPDQFMVELEKVVAERGLDYTYKTDRHIAGCWYSTEDGEGSCAIGKIIEAVDPDLFREVATYEDEVRDSCPIGGLFVELGLPTHPTPETEKLAIVAQALQDRGYRYEAVLELTRRVHEGLDWREVVHAGTEELEELLDGTDLVGSAAR